jgi:nitrogen fixation-related uncharacterized protein
MKGVRTMQSIFDILIPLALLAVLVTLGFGIYSLYRGGDFARSNSNKLMRLRIVLQAVALVILAAAFWWSAHSR